MNKKPEFAKFEMNQKLRISLYRLLRFVVRKLISSFYVLQESELLVVESFPTDSLNIFVRESLNDMVERSSAARQNVGKLLSHLVKADVIPLNMYLSG
jgi:hypothetical protein